ncbi:MAG: L-2-amino-thiazoline-4-carboxylic acid hydrolase [Synergistaceae bacterium]|jgi:hypothetical protein|nr:L-2-amino-thiazoline-4-carboxylic acid hydrolase [Synergistaceae bacterium]
MNRFKEIELESLQDSWVIMYTFIARELLEKGGFEGERVLREAVRRYGRDRGLSNRRRLLENNVKINLATLFSEGRDRPGEPRFTAKVLRGTREERISDTLICSFADVWKKYDAKHLGRIYCEEFHIASYQAFGFGKTKVNLSRTLTQDGDDRCCFYHTYRPENLTDEERRLSFEEYDEGYVKPDREMPKPEGKSGFRALWIKMYFHFLETAAERWGEDDARSLVGSGLRAAAVEQARVFAEIARSTERVVDEGFLEGHHPLSLGPSPGDETLPEACCALGAQSLLFENYCLTIRKELGLDAA